MNDDICTDSSNCLAQNINFRQEKMELMREQCHAMVFYVFEEGLNQDECVQRLPRSAVIPDYVSAIRKMLMGDNHRTYQMIQKELNNGSAAIHEIIHK
ncbi:UNVERIFIED_CONTAM: hypothetical protein NCL1_48291 [Trichonephila clavipes]